MFTFSIVIATYKRPDLLRRLTNSLADLEYPESCQSIWVVENGEKSGSEKILDEVSLLVRKEYLFVPEAGKSNALNTVMEKITEDYIVFFDDDIKVEKNLLTAYQKVINSFGSGYFYGGEVRPDYEKQPEQWLVPYLPGSVAGFSLGNEVVEIDKPVLLGANWAAFKTDIEKTGGFNPDFGPVAGQGAVGQEREMQERMLAKGYKAVYVPDVIVWHYVPEDRCSEQWLKNRYYRHGLKDGKQLAMSEASSALLLGVPRWLWRKWLITRIQLMLQVFSPKTRRADNIFELMELKGKIEGFRIARRNS